MISTKQIAQIARLERARMTRDWWRFGEQCADAYHTTEGQVVKAFLEQDALGTGAAQICQNPQ